MPATTDPAGSQGMTHLDKIDSNRFRNVLGHHPTGISVVTAMASGGPVGMVVGTFTSVSLDPPLVAFMPAKSSTSWPLIRDAGKFCANVLSAEQEELCRSFSRSGGDKFDGVAWRPSPGGSPILDDVVAWVDCDIDDVVESGDHYIVIGRVKNLDIVKSVTPLAFFRGEFGQVSSGGKQGELSSFKAEQLAALFTENASRQASAREIADLVGAGQWQSDEMFQSRETIVRQILTDYLGTLLDRYRRVISQASDSRETLARLIGVIFASVEDHRAATVLFQNERAGLRGGSHGEIPKLEREMRDLWEIVLRKGMDEGVFRKGLDPAMVYFMIRDATFVAARWYRKEGPYSVEELSRQYADLILNGVLG